MWDPEESPNQRLRAWDLSGIIHVDVHTRVYTADSITRRLMASILACARREQMNYTIAPRKLSRGCVQMNEIYDKRAIIQRTLTNFNINFESRARFNHKN